MSSKYIIVHLQIKEGEELKKLDSVDQLRKYLENGATQLLVHREEQCPMSSFLSFENMSYPSGNKNEKTMFEENNKKEIKAGEFDEEQSEIRFIRKPEFYHEFSNNLQTLLVTNCDETRDFANSTRINNSFCRFESGDVKRVLTVEEHSKDIELFIFDVKVNDIEKVKSIMKEVSEFEQENKQVYLNIIISPFLNESSTSEYLNEKFRLNRLANSDQQSLIQSILPIQTWQTYQGQIDEEFSSANKLASLSIFYDKNGCRQDKIKQFDNIKDNLHLFGFSHINATFLFREITFKLGKLPKYGA